MSTSNSAPKVTRHQPKRRFAITGGAGFIGSRLTATLLAEGHRVTVLDDLSTGSLDNVGAFRSHPNFSLAVGSILDEETVSRFVEGQDIVVHLAAAVGVKLIVEQPVRTLETNVRGAEHVLQAARRHEARVLIASSSEVYGKSDRMPFRERDDVLLGPTSSARWGYAASKLLDEFLALGYHEKHGTDVVVFRLFNTIGPAQRGRYGMVVPRFVRAALAGEPLVVHGDGLQRRCFCHVQDTVDAIQGLSFCPQASGKVFNIGSTEEVSIRELAELVRDLTESRSAIELTPYERVYGDHFEDPRRRVPSVDRIRRYVGWRPQWSLEETLRDVIASEIARQAKAAPSVQAR